MFEPWLYCYTGFAVGQALLLDKLLVLDKGSQQGIG